MKVRLISEISENVYNMQHVRTSSKRSMSTLRVYHHNHQKPPTTELGTPLLTWYLMPSSPPNDPPDKEETTTGVLLSLAEPQNTGLANPKTPTIPRLTKIVPPDPKSNDSQVHPLDNSPSAMANVRRDKTRINKLDTGRTNTAQTIPCKRTRADSQEDEEKASKDWLGENDEKSVEDKMETDLTGKDSWAGMTPSRPMTPAAHMCSTSPTGERLDELEIAANNQVLQHLLVRAAKNAKKAAQAPLLPPPPKPPRPENDPLLFSPTPADGFPRVHGHTSTRIFDNLEHNQMSAWLSLEDPHVFVQPLLHGYYPAQVAPEMLHLI